MLRIRLDQLAIFRECIRKCLIQSTTEQESCNHLQYIILISLTVLYFYIHVTLASLALVALSHNTNLLGGKATSSRLYRGVMAGIR